MLNWKTILFCTLLALLANVLAPRTASERGTYGCLIFVPARFVRQKILDYDFISDLQASGALQSIDAIRLPDYTRLKTKAPNHQPSTVFETRPDDILGLVNPIEPRKRRLARVKENSETIFVFEERLPWFNTIRHTFTFVGQDQTAPNEWRTVFEHQREWEGSKFALFLRYRRWLVGRVGESFTWSWEEDRGSPLKDAVEKAWADVTYETNHREQ